MEMLNRVEKKVGVNHIPRCSYYVIKLFTKELYCCLFLHSFMGLTFYCTIFDVSCNINSANLSVAMLEIFRAKAICN